MQYRRDINFGRSPFGSFTGIIITVLIFLALFYIARFVFKLLWWVAPVLLIATLIIDYKVVWGYLQWIGRTIKNNPALGIGAIVLTLLGFPVVVAFLFGKALFKRKIKQATDEARAKQEGYFIEYEEIVEDEPLELPEVEKPKPQPKKSNEYDNLFE